MENGNVKKIQYFGEEMFGSDVDRKFIKFYVGS